MTGKEHDVMLTDLTKANTDINKLMSKPGRPQIRERAYYSKKGFKKPFNDLLYTVRDRKDGHRQFFFGKPGVTPMRDSKTKKNSNKAWLKCFKAHHYRDCPDFDLEKAMKGCRYTQLEPDKDKSEYIIPESYKSPSGSSEKIIFREKYDNVYKLLKENEHYSRMFPVHQNGEIDCPKNLRKPSHRKVNFGEDEDDDELEKLDKIQKRNFVHELEEDKSRGFFGQYNSYSNRVERVPFDWSRWGDQGDPLEERKELEKLLNKATTRSKNVIYKDDRIKLDKYISEIKSAIEKTKKRVNKKEHVPEELRAMVDAEYAYSRNPEVDIHDRYYSYPESTWKTLRNIRHKDQKHNRSMGPGRKPKLVTRSNRKIRTPTGQTPSPTRSPNGDYGVQVTLPSRGKNHKALAEAEGVRKKRTKKKRRKKTRR